MKTDEAQTILIEWQTEPFTEKVLRQLHEIPQVVINRESVIRHTRADHNVPDISNIASYVECTSESTRELHASAYEDDNIENELTRMFSNEHDKPIETKEPQVTAPISKKHKRRAALKKLVELFGSALDDLEEPTPRKRIRKRRRHTLPVSLPINPEILTPLRVKEKRRSEPDPGTCKKVVRTNVARTVEVTYSRVTHLVLPPVYHETARVTYSDHEMETAFVVGQPQTGHSETAKATQKMTTFIDLTTEEENTVMEFSGIKVAVKGEYFKGENKAPSMPSLSPNKPPDATKGEQVILTQRPPPPGKQPELEIFPVETGGSAPIVFTQNIVVARATNAGAGHQQPTVGNKAVAQVVPLKEKIHGQKRPSVESSKTMEAPLVPSRRKCSTDKTGLPDHFNVPLSGIQQQPTLNQAPDLRQVNASVLDELVQWEAAKKRALIQSQAPTGYPVCRPNFQVPPQWQWSTVNNPQIVQRPNAEPTYSQLPPRLVRLLSVPTDFTLISNSMCAERLYPHVNKFVQWRCNASQFHEKSRLYVTPADFKEHSNKFMAYFNSLRVVFSRNMVKELSGVEVRDFNIHQILTYLSVKIVEGNRTVTVFRICSTLYSMLGPVEAELNTPFLRKLFTTIKTSVQKMEEKSKKALFTAAQLQVLQTQIREYNHIQNWLSANIGSVPLRVRIPPQKKQPPQQNAQRWQRSAVTETTRNVPQETNASTGESTTAQAPESVTDKNAPAQNRESVAEPNTQTPVVPENPQTKKNVQESQECNKEQTAVPTNEVNSVKNESKDGKDEEVIDLTWIEDGDQEEILEEIIECKYFPFKAENYEESEVVAREVVSPTDSGLGSPVAQSDSDGFKCLCGNKAIYVCACNSSMYCSSDCQGRDWVYHQKLCHKMKS
ncbi:hypothetical protein Zmor_022350 [Zophobas morio]|uniref:MYND-type domain-containing protein n=1 Tax=Zophobas morio TaxID=2755281 RepID=A0AA38M6C4_9CUCU|nr:hypothetical protein Zmor_022350 [Zophobas morio]